MLRDENIELMQLEKVVEVFRGKGTGWKVNGIGIMEWHGRNVGSRYFDGFLEGLYLPLSPMNK